MKDEYRRRRAAKHAASAHVRDATLHRNTKVLDAMPEGDMMVVEVRRIEELPDGFTHIKAVPGTAAHEYIVDVGKLRTMISDPRYIGSFIEDYGYLSIFTDGSSLRTEITAPFLRGAVRESLRGVTTDYLRHAHVVTPPAAFDAVNEGDGTERE